jgi:nucleoid-associated protein YgaU
VKIFNDNRKTTERYGTAAWDRSRQRLHAGAILFAACAFSAGAPIWAQDVAEAARQEQTRRDQQARRTKHVYTEEDLKRARILTREDRELLDAKKREQLKPGATTSPALVDAQALEQLPLGDVARMFRALKEFSQAGQSAEFHLPVAGAALAAPGPQPEFIAPRPRATRPAIHRILVAPEFPNLPTAAHTAPGLNREAVMSQPRPEFAMPKPRVLQASTRPTPLAPVFRDASAPPTIIVKLGDSFWKLAQVNLGDGHRWHEIAAINPSIVNPHHIVPGTPINILAGSAPFAPVAPVAPAGSQVTVRKGDSLWRIAQIQLGSGGFWGCIAKANPMIIDANRIYAGQVITLPVSCGPQR